MDRNFHTEFYIHDYKLQSHLVEGIVKYLEEVVPVRVSVGVLVGHERGHQGLHMDPPQLHVPLKGGGTQTCDSCEDSNITAVLIPSASRK